MSASYHFAFSANSNMLVYEDFSLDFSTGETRNHNTTLTCTIKSSFLFIIYLKLMEPTCNKTSLSIKSLMDIF